MEDHMLRHPKGISRHDSTHGAGLPKRPKMKAGSPNSDPLSHWLAVRNHLKVHDPKNRQALRKASKMLGRVTA